MRVCFEPNRLVPLALLNQLKIKSPYPVFVNITNANEAENYIMSDVKLHNFPTQQQNLQRN